MDVAKEIQIEVWSILHTYRWFGKHVDDDQLDHMYESIGQVIEATIERKAGKDS